jgi:cytochrome c-type biogenesis protein CcmE
MMRLKLFIAGTIFLAAVVYLAVAGVRSGWVYFMDVDQFLADEKFHDQRVRLHGPVGLDDFFVSPGSLTARFQLLGDSGQITVEYAGVIPDMFEAGKDVVVEGRVGEAGVFLADTLMTKCASKYEPVSPHAEVASNASR